MKKASSEIYRILITFLTIFDIFNDIMTIYFNLEKQELSLFIKKKKNSHDCVNDFKVKILWRIEKFCTFASLRYLPVSQERGALSWQKKLLLSLGNTVREAPACARYDDRRKRGSRS